MEATGAVELYGLLTAAGERCWLVGGWGVDALLGRQTRPHHDLDVFTLLADLPAHTDRLARHGYLDARGTIAGTEVACATAAAQLVWHTGYDLPDTHRRDVAHLHALQAAPDRPAG